MLIFNNASNEEFLLKRNYLNLIILRIISIETLIASLICRAVRPSIILLLIIYLRYKVVRYLSSI